MKKDEKSYESKFRSVGGYYLIELRLSGLDQLYNNFDPSPFHDKDIKESVEHYLVNSVRAFPLKTKLKLVLTFQDAQQKNAPEVLLKSIENYFGYKAKTSEREIRTLLHEGKIAFLLGGVFLFTCLSTRAALKFVEKLPLGSIVLEGLTIIGWVAMWKPVQVFLYDWWAHYRTKRIFEKIRDIPIELCFD